MATALRAPVPHTTPRPRSAPDYSELRQLIRERLRLFDHPDPIRAVNGLLNELPEDMLRLAAAKGLWAITGEVVRVDRSEALRRQPQASGKWNGVADAEKAHPDLFAERIYVGLDPDQPYKFLGDCTREDLQAAAQHKRVHAQGVLAEADRYIRLARFVKRDQVVRDLGLDVVRGAFNA